VIDIEPRPTAGFFLLRCPNKKGIFPVTLQQ